MSQRVFIIVWGLRKHRAYQILMIMKQSLLTTNPWWQISDSLHSTDWVGSVKRWEKLQEPKMASVMLPAIQIATTLHCIYIFVFCFIWCVHLFLIFHIWVKSYNICLSSDISFSIIPSRSIHVFVNGKISSFLWLRCNLLYIKKMWEIYISYSWSYGFSHHWYSELHWLIFEYWTNLAFLG